MPKTIDHRPNPFARTYALVEEGSSTQLTTFDTAERVDQGDFLRITLHKGLADEATIVREVTDNTGDMPFLKIARTAPPPSAFVDHPATASLVPPADNRTP